MSPPAVAITYACGDQVVDARGCTHGMAVTPMEGGLVVSLCGTPAQVLEMIVAAMDSARAFGLDDALRLCVERGVGRDQIREVLGEQWWEISGEAPE